MSRNTVAYGGTPMAGLQSHAIKNKNRKKFSQEAGI